MSQTTSAPGRSDDDTTPVTREHISDSVHAAALPSHQQIADLIPARTM
ncbi:hypothetical protein [Streptomyces tremellae]